MSSFSPIFKLRPDRWADEDPADKASTESGEHLLPKNESETTALQVPQRLITVRHVFIAVILLILWGGAAFMLGNVTGKRQQNDPWGSFENGFVEEQVVTPSDMFELVQRTFTGGVDFTPEGVEVLAPSLYVGEPTPEIDEAWNAIIGGESHYFSVSEVEAIELWGSESDRYRDRIRGGWTGTLDLFHCLHCLVCQSTKKSVAPRLLSRRGTPRNDTSV
ncbi:hypothetical protein BP6252_10260 [Coleophoma cylindrospora]|uniref:Uncharacterized protein n=1 Tax=Coleophoma cylindrospora TaxID=1849047 RepID=A0A3D8QS18_9HELO|nr:hypothetical protein BP6252_10260 [Coleophoma cylindrospora]